MIAFTPEAARQVDDLRAHYEALERPVAVSALMAALDAATRRIAAAPHRGLPAPRPYPALARAGRFWIKSGRYWIAYRIDGTTMIVGVFYETADIPRRI